jgi:hypothetical protein
MSAREAPPRHNVSQMPSAVAHGGRFVFEGIRWMSSTTELRGAISEHSGRAHDGCRHPAAAIGKTPRLSAGGER